MIKHALSIKADQPIAFYVNDIQSISLENSTINLLSISLML